MADAVELDALWDFGDPAGSEDLAELDALGETDGYVLDEIAECLLALGRGDEARPLFARA